MIQYSIFPVWKHQVSCKHNTEQQNVPSISLLWQDFLVLLLLSAKFLKSRCSSDMNEEGRQMPIPVL